MTGMAFVFMAGLVAVGMGCILMAGASFAENHRASGAVLALSGGGILGFCVWAISTVGVL